MTFNPSEINLESSLKLIQSIHTKIMAPKDFQREQMHLKHSTILDHVIVGCQLDEVLVEVLRQLKMGIILDRNTLQSRTSWLAGTIDNSYVLMVLDSVLENGITRASIDIWSDVKDIPTAIFHAIRETPLGEVSENYKTIDVQWYLTKKTDNKQLVIELSSSINDSRFLDENIYFFVDYQGTFTDSFCASFPINDERVSVAINLADIRASYCDQLCDPYLTIYIGDAEWKSIEKYNCICFTWQDALIHQVNRHLTKGSRFTSFSELSGNLNLNDAGDSLRAKMLFLDFCKAQEVTGCKNQRISDHCSRAIILTGLVICFNPPRGLSGYLDMILGSNEIEQISNLGSDRTWREHLSGIVNLAQDFQPTPVKLSSSKKNRKPGRPPTQLIPTTPPAVLFDSFAKSPEEVVCKICRFHDSN